MPLLWEIIDSARILFLQGITAYPCTLTQSAHGLPIFRYGTGCPTLTLTPSGTRWRLPCFMREWISSAPQSVWAMPKSQQQATSMPTPSKAPTKRQAKRSKICFSKKRNQGRPHRRRETAHSIQERQAFASIELSYLLELLTKS